MLNRLKNYKDRFITNIFVSIPLTLLIIFMLNGPMFSTGIPSFVNLHQPNGYTFTAQGEGDEFLQRFKTIDNFTIVCSADNWWYYAYLGTDGKLYPTQYRVGIEDDNAQSTLTEDINFSQSVIDAANSQRTLFNSSLTVQSVSPITIGIILVDFPDRISSRINPSDPNNVMDFAINDPANTNWAKRYTMNNFQQLFFSTNTYNTSSPDNYPVYGSVNDYYKQTSYNLVSVSGAILNPADANGKPNWYRAENSISTYTPSTLREEAILAAVDAGFNPAAFNKICIIYAGPWGGSANNIWPQMIPLTNTWIMGERNSAWDGDYGFASIGVHVHEMSHTLGLRDLYAPEHPYFEQTCGIGAYGLTGYGNLGALLNKHSKPVLMNAYERATLGYLTPQIVSTNQMNKQIPNIEQNSFALKIMLYNYSGDSEYFLVENKQPIGFDSDIPTGGIIISHYVSDGSWYQQGRPLLDIEEVGGIPFTGCGSERNLYPLDFYNRPNECNSTIPNSQVEPGDFLNIQNQVFSPWSYPNSNRANITASSDVALVFKSIGSTSVVDVFKTNAVSAPPSKPPLGFFHAGDGPIQYGWAYLAWGADYFYNPIFFHIEPDYAWSELQRKIGVNGIWQTVYSGSNRWWSDHSIIYDPINGDTPVFFRVRIKDSQNKWSIWSDLYDTRTFTNSEGGLGKKLINENNFPLTNKLSTNFPNPFNPSTIINYAVKDAGLVSLKVYDILGAEVATLVNETKEAGEYAVEFNATALPSGVYIYTLQVNGFTSSKKMLLMK